MHEEIMGSNGRKKKVKKCKPIYTRNKGRKKILLQTSLRWLFFCCSCGQHYIPKLTRAVTITMTLHPKSNTHSVCCPACFMHSCPDPTTIPYCCTPVISCRSSHSAHRFPFLAILNYFYHSTLCCAVLCSSFYGDQTCRSWSPVVEFLR